MDLIKDIFGTDFSLITILVCFLAVIILVLFSLNKLEKLNEKEKKIKTLQDNLNEMDEQARLIVKTDLELSQTQEELDRKITSLLALQRFAQVLSSSLEEEKIFASIREEMINELGFELCLIVLKQNDQLVAKVALGFKSQDTREPLLRLMEEKVFLRLLAKEKTLHHANHSSALEVFQHYCSDRLKLKSYIATTIHSKEDVLGAIVFGNYLDDLPGGTKEIMDILSNQIAQTLENITLFERLYNSQKDLEDKIHERTMDLQKALEQIKRISGLKSEFVSSVSHELRTPLTSIKGYASLLIQEKFGKLPEETKVRLARINQQADTLVTMINGLLDIARIESGKMKIEIQRIDLIEIVKRVADLLYPQVNQKTIALTVNVPDELFVDADKKLMERVMINLLSNAIKFTPEGKKIEIRVVQDKDTVRVSVKDEGMGIATDDLENVFKEFYRTKGALTQEIKGTGLGLSLVKNIVKAHNGDIWAESKLGEGADFIFILPGRSSV